MNIIDAAKAYLEDSPSEWLRAARALTSNISTWGSLQLEEGRSDVHRELTNLLFPQLLSPDLVHIIAGCSNVREAQEFITNTIADVLKNKSIEYGGESNSYEDEIVDLTSTDFPMLERLVNRAIVNEYGGGSTFRYSDENDLTSTDFSLVGRLVTRAYDLEGEYGDAEPLLTIHNAQELFLNETELKNVIARTFESLSVTARNNIGSIFRLDIVDVALYQTLIQHPELLRSLNWRTFEELLADILESFGYEVELQQGTKDGGVDLFAVKRIDVFGPQRFLLQAKRYSNKVGVEPVRQLAFLHSHLRATKSCLATTATFTKGAWELAQQYQWQLELRDFDGLQEWIRHAATKHLWRGDA